MANVIARVGSAGLLGALLITCGVLITSLYSREITAEYEGRVIRENDGNDPAYMDTFEEMDNANTR